LREEDEFEEDVWIATMLQVGETLRCALLLSAAISQFDAMMG